MAKHVSCLLFIRPLHIPKGGGPFLILFVPRERLEEHMTRKRLPQRTDDFVPFAPLYDLTPQGTLGRLHPRTWAWPGVRGHEFVGVGVQREVGGWKHFECCFWDVWSVPLFGACLELCLVGHGLERGFEILSKTSNDTKVTWQDDQPKDFTGSVMFPHVTYP